GVTVAPVGPEPTGMSTGFLVLVFTSIVDTESLPLLVTKAVLPSGVTATLCGAEPTVMSVGFLVLVFTSIVATELPLGSSAAPRLPCATTTISPAGGTAAP